MEGVGHHDFGLTLRPIGFDGWLDDAGDPEHLEFWLRYWNVAYRHILKHLGPSTHLVSYAHLTSEPHAALRRLAETIEVPLDDMSALSSSIRVPRSHDFQDEGINRDTRDAARRIFSDLKEVYQSDATTR